MPQALSDIIAQLEPSYAPQRQTISDESTALDANAAENQKALDATKEQSFSDITNAANGRGVLYSGVPISEQATYLGTKYLPAVASLKQNTQQGHFQLDDALNKLNADEQSSAQTTQADQAKAEADAAYKAQELELSREKVAASAAKASIPSAAVTAQNAKSALLSELGSIAGQYQSTLGSNPNGLRENIIQSLTSKYGAYVDPKTISSLVYSTYLPDSLENANRSKASSSGNSNLMSALGYGG